MRLAILLLFTATVCYALLCGYCRFGNDPAYPNFGPPTTDKPAPTNLDVTIPKCDSASTYLGVESDGKIRLITGDRSGQVVDIPSYAACEKLDFFMVCWPKDRDRPGSVYVLPAGAINSYFRENPKSLDSMLCTN